MLCRPPSPLSGTRLSGRQASIARRRPRPPGTTSRRTSHMAVLTVAPRRAWPPHPQWARARHAITLAVKRRAVITSAKGETEAATRPTARARRRLPALRQALSAGLEQLTSWCERERNRIEWVRPDAGALCCLRLRRDAFDDAHVAAFWDLLPHHTCRCAPEHQPLLVSDQGAAAVSWTPELERPRRHRRM